MSRVTDLLNCPVHKLDLGALVGRGEQCIALTASLVARRFCLSSSPRVVDSLRPLHRCLSDYKVLPTCLWRLLLASVFSQDVGSYSLVVCARGSWPWLAELARSAVVFWLPGSSKMFDVCVHVVGLRRGLRCGLLQEVRCWAMRRLADDCRGCSTVGLFGRFGFIECHSKEDRQPGIVKALVRAGRCRMWAGSVL